MNIDTNILEAIYNIVHHKKFAIKLFYSAKNRANSMEDVLESYIKDAFSDTLNVNDELSCLQVYSQKFS